MPCENCNNNSPFSTFSLQATYPTACVPSECSGQVFKTKCVYYSGANLSCSGINTNDSLELALQKIDTQICTITGDYSTYNTYCLAPITTQRQFVETISEFVCNTQTSLSTFTGTTFPAYQSTVNTRFTALEVPGITCSFASVTNTDTLQQILTKYCTAFTTLNNKFSLSGVNWGQCFTVVSNPTSIADAFSLLVDQICQVKSMTSGSLPVFNNIGTCLPSPGSSDTLVSTINKIITKLCSLPTFNINSINWGYLTKPSSVDNDLQSAFQTITTKVSDNSFNAVTGYSADFVVSATNPSDPTAGKTIALATPISQDRYVAATNGDSSPGVLQSKLYAGTGITLDYTTNAGKATIISTGLTNVSNTNSIQLTGNGTSGTPLAANLKISAQAGNTAIINSDGIFVPAVTVSPYTFSETSTVKPTVVSTVVSMDVKIDSSQPGNILTYSSNGLYCPAPNVNATTINTSSSSSLSITATPGSGNVYTLSGNVRVSPTAAGQFLTTLSDGLAATISQTAGNAITLNADGIYVSSGAAQVNSDWNASSGVAQILNKPTISNGVTFTAGSPGSIGLGGSLTGNTVITTGTYSLGFTGSTSTVGNNTIPFYSTVVFTGTGTESNQYQISPFSAGLSINNTSTFTPFSASKHAAYTATVYKDGNGTYAGILSTFYGTTEVKGSGNITTIAQFRAFAPQISYSQTYTGTITNAVGIYIDDLTTDASLTSRITNRFAIYQAGSTDISRFFGPVQNAGGTVQFTSDERVKTNIQSFTKGLDVIESINPKTFEYTYNEGKVITGIIAQELETVLPEAVSKGNFDTPKGESFTDFRFVDEKVVFYTLVNAIKELSAKNKELEKRLSDHNL